MGSGQNRTEHWTADLDPESELTRLQDFSFQTSIFTAVIFQSRRHRYPEPPGLRSRGRKWNLLRGTAWRCFAMGRMTLVNGGDG